MNARSMASHFASTVTPESVANELLKRPNTSSGLSFAQESEAGRLVCPLGVKQPAGPHHTPCLYSVTVKRSPRLYKIAHLGKTVF